MTRDTLTVPAYLTGRLDTPRESANSLAFDLTGVNFHEEDDLVVELLIEQAQHTGCASVEIRDGAGRSYGRTRAGAGAGPMRVFLNASASEDIRRASGGFFTLEALFADSDGMPQAFTLGTRHVGLLTIVPRESAASMVGAA